MLHAIPRGIKANSAPDRVIGATAGRQWLGGKLKARRVRRGRSSLACGGEMRPVGDQFACPANKRSISVVPGVAPSDKGVTGLAQAPGRRAIDQEPADRLGQACDVAEGDEEAV